MINKWEDEDCLGITKDYLKKNTSLNLEYYYKDFISKKIVEELKKDNDKTISFEKVEKLRNKIDNEYNLKTAFNYYKDTNEYLDKDICNDTDKRLVYDKVKSKIYTRANDKSLKNFAMDVYDYVFPKLADLNKSYLNNTFIGKGGYKDVYNDLMVDTSLKFAYERLNGDGCSGKYAAPVELNHVLRNAICRLGEDKNQVLEKPVLLEEPKRPTRWQRFVNFFNKNKYKDEFDRFKKDVEAYKDSLLTYSERETDYNYNKKQLRENFKNNLDTFLTNTLKKEYDDNDVYIDNTLTYGEDLNRESVDIISTNPEINPAQKEGPKGPPYNEVKIDENLLKGPKKD